jgi:hypothetical protein
MTKSKIAVMIAVMLAVPAAVAQVEQASLEAASEPVAITETSTTATEVAVEPSAQPAEIVAQADAAVSRPAPVLESRAATSRSARAQRHSAEGFPMGAESEYSYKPLPAMVAYWTQLDQQRRNLVARGDVFAMGAESEHAYRQVPAAVAYWDGVERQRIARAEPQRLASAEARNPLQRAADFVTKPFKSERADAPQAQQVTQADTGSTMSAESSAQSQ